MRTALILLALLLAMPAALAQDLPVPTCGPIAIPSPPAAPQPIAPGESADLVVVVSNGGNVDVVVTVTASTTAAGWTLGDPPAPATIQRGQTGSFAFRATASPEAAEAADVSFAASGSCDPGLPTCPPNVCASDPVNTQVRVPLAAAEGLTLPFLENLNVPIELLVAAVVLIGLASAIPFLMRRSKGGIVAQCPEPLKMVKPGRGTSFPIELRNGTKAAATAQFEVGAVPEGWSAFMPLPEVQLAAREARSLWLMVRSPATAGTGDAVDVELRLKDPRGKENGFVKVRAEVQGGES